MRELDAQQHLTSGQYAYRDAPGRISHHADTQHSRLVPAAYQPPPHRVSRPAVMAGLADVPRRRGRPRKADQMAVAVAEKLASGLLPPNESQDPILNLPVDSPQVESFDRQKHQKYILVMGLRLMALAMRDRTIPLLERCNLYLRAQSQWEGTRREIIYDTRKVDDKVLLADMERTKADIEKFSALLTPERRAEIELAAAVTMLKDTAGDPGDGSGGKSH